jgi:hypothetical protein
MKQKVIIDKHLDPEAMGKAVGRFAMSAATHAPQSKYRGSHPTDEDYDHVLQLAWENQALLLSRDGAMIKKAIQFRRDLPRIGEERCLRGVLVLPLHKADQVAALRDFLAGKLEIVRSRAGIPIPESLDDVEDGNFGIDLRQARPKAIELCDCEWEPGECVSRALLALQSAPAFQSSLLE